MHAAVTNQQEASFTGTLIRRQYQSGQTYVQLVFKGAKETRLSITKNLKMVRALHVGKRYRVIGTEYVVGSKKVIRDPRAIPLAEKTRRSRKYWFAAALLGALMLLTGSALAAKRYVLDSAATKPAPNVSQTNVQATTEETVNVTAPAASPPATTPSPSTTTSPRSTRTNSPTTAASTPSTTATTTGSPVATEPAAPVQATDVPPTPEIIDPAPVVQEPPAPPPAE